MNYLALLAISATIFTATISTTKLTRPTSMPTDTTYGRLVSTIVADATFYLFDATNPNLAVLRVNGLDRKMIYEGPEMACFLANHAKEDLEITYHVYERKNEAGETVRTDGVARLRSLKSGDDTRTWLQKEQADSLVMRRHHEALKKLMQEYH